MLTFIGLANLRDATLLQVLFNLHIYALLRYCILFSSYIPTFSSMYTLTRCCATARFLQFTGLRDVTLTGVGGWVGGCNNVNVEY